MLAQVDLQPHEFHLQPSIGLCGITPCERAAPGSQEYELKNAQGRKEDLLIPGSQQG